MNPPHFSRALDTSLLLTLALAVVALLPLLADGGAGAARWLIAIGALTGAGGLHQFCLRRSGRLGAVIGGVLYITSPLLAFSMQLAPADSGPLLALALTPPLLWRVDRLRDRPSASNFLLALPLQIALLSLTGRLGISLTLFVFSWVLAETLIQRFNREASQVAAGPSLLALLALLLGAIGSAPMWLLALTLPAAESLSVALGWAQALAALLGAALAALLYIRGYRSRHPQALLGTAIFSLMALALLLNHPASLETPLANLAPLTLCMAAVGSANGSWLERLPRRANVILAALFVSLPLAAAQFLPPAVMPPASAALPPAPAELPLSLACAILGTGFIALRLRGFPLTARPYWHSPPLASSAAIGIALGGLIALALGILGAGGSG